MAYKQNPGRGPMQKTGHGIPEGMTSPLKQAKSGYQEQVQGARKAFKEGKISRPSMDSIIGEEKAMRKDSIANAKKKGKDVKSGRERVNIKAIPEDGSPSYSVTAFKDSPVHKASKELGSIPNAFRAGKANSKARDSHLTGLSASEKKARAARNLKQEMDEKKAGTYYNKDGSVTQWTN